MPGPSLTFGFILATLYGALFHFILGGDARRLALFLLASWMGFALGQIVGVVFNLRVLDIGPLHLLSATFGALLALVGARLLSSDRLRSE